MLPSWDFIIINWYHSKWFADILHIDKYRINFTIQVRIFHNMKKLKNLGKYSFIMITKLEIDLRWTSKLLWCVEETLDQCVAISPFCLGTGFVEEAMSGGTLVGGRGRGCSL